jgi:LPS-assembly lipoprotein
MHHWRIRLLALTAYATVAVLGGCGFEPLMGQSNHPHVQSGLERIRIAPIADRSGQILRNYLLDGLTPRGLQGSDLYVLTVTLIEPRREVAIRRDDTASRLGYTAAVSFVLYERSTESRVFGGASLSETTYEVTSSEFATLSSQASARDRALQEVSMDIRQQLATFFAGKAPRYEPQRTR